MGKIKKFLISIFLGMHLTMMLLSGCPEPSALSLLIVRKLNFYQKTLGLDQNWSMFAPNPLSVNSYLDAVITFDNNSTEKWTFPRESQLNSWNRFFAGERLRKYQQERLFPQDKTPMWIDLSNYLVHEIDKIERVGQNRKVKNIVFRRHSQKIKSPHVEFIKHGDFNPSYQTETVFEHRVTVKG